MSLVRLVLQRDEYVCAVCHRPAADTAAYDDPTDLTTAVAVHRACCTPPTQPVTSRDW